VFDYILFPVHTFCVYNFVDLIVLLMR